ncbi:MAG: cobalamin B12-binding domain-containing protein [Pseudomonadota bacterium]
MTNRGNGHSPANLGSYGSKEKVAKTRTSSGERSELLAVLGSGAVGRRVRGRMMGEAAPEALAELSSKRFLNARAPASMPIAPGWQYTGLVEWLNRDLDALLSALIKNDQTLIAEVTNDLQYGDVAFSAFYREIAVPLAHQLGLAWIDDTLSMMDVEFASSRLMLWCDQVATIDRSEIASTGEGRSILLVNMPGSKHTLGVSILAKCFVHSGWHVDSGVDHVADHGLTQRLREHRFDVVGITVGSSSARNSVKEVVSEIRASTMHDDIIIGVGGAGVARDPEGFANIGVDFLALDAMDAVDVANDLVESAEAALD